MEFFGILALAVVIEGVVTYANEWFVKGKPQWKQIATVLFGVAIALAYGVDLVAMLGLESTVPFVGSVLSGILLSRGSNYLNDLLQSLQALGTKA